MLTLKITNTFRRKNGVAPPSVSRVMKTAHTMSDTTEYGPTRRPRTYSERTSRKSTTLNPT
jgi:hypothetical protein